MKRTIALFGLSLALLTGGVVAAPTATAGEPTAGPLITRSEVLARSASWIAEGVPYGMTWYHTNQYGRFRQDCSGYVSMAWGVFGDPTVGEMRAIMHDIPRSDLKPGDALFRYEAHDQHIALFVGWADNAKTRPIVRQEPGPGGFAEEKVWDASHANTFTPKRYNNIIDGPKHDRVGDVSGDGYADLLGTMSDGTLHYFPNNILTNPDGWPYTTSTQIGVGFAPFTQLRAGDVSGDGYADLIGVQGDGSLHYLPNNILTNPGGRPYGNAINIGSGFQIFTNILVGDVSGDGYADLLATMSDGTLHYFPNNILTNPGGRPYTTSTQIGVGFAPFTQLRAGDVSGDGYADLIGVQGDGSLHYLPNNILTNPGGRPYGNAINIGSGFQIFTSVVTGDVDGDGWTDLMGVKADGTVHCFLNEIRTNSRPYIESIQIGVGFQMFNRIV